MSRAVVISAVRTPVGRYGGALAGVEAGRGGEGRADLGREVGDGQGLGGSFDEDEVAGGADAEADPAGRLEVAAGGAGGRGGDQQGGAVPE